MKTLPWLTSHLAGRQPLLLAMRDSRKLVMGFQGQAWANIGHECGQFLGILVVSRQNFGGLQFKFWGSMLAHFG